MKTQFFETGPLHADEGQEWTADTHGEKSKESQCEIRSKTEIHQKITITSEATDRILTSSIPITIMTTTCTYQYHYRYCHFLDSPYCRRSYNHHWY